MAEFVDQSVTYAGRMAIAESLAGKMLEFTRIEFGDGNLPDGKAVEDMVALVSPKDSVMVTKCQALKNNTAIVGGVFTNTEKEEGYHWRELGLFARNPANPDEEILFCYGNAGELAEWIPPSAANTVYEKRIDIITYVGSSANVTVSVPLASYLTVENLLDVYPVGREICSADEMNPAMAIGGTWEHQADYHGMRQMHYYRRIA